MYYPKISIVTPNYNGATYLEETILSVISQNYPNLEYIIIDGGSTDGSVEIIKKYERDIAHWVSEPDNGLYHALQKGFDKSTGEIMAWINSDDKYHPNSFFTISDIFTTFPQIEWLTGCSTELDEKGRTIHVGQSRIWSKYDFLTFDYKWIQQESTVWRRSLWNKAGNQIGLNLKYAGDLELWLRFFRYEKLYTSQILIGGFRIRKAGQLSLEYHNDYVLEAENAIKEEQISKDDKKILNRYYRILRFNKILEKIGFRKFDSLISNFKKNHYDYPPEIIFDRYTQNFIMIDSA